MAELLSDPTFYLMLIVLLVLGVLTYYEMRFMKRKRMERASAQAKLDDIYNQIVTSQAVSRALRGQGMDTKEADLAILEAETAYGRRDYPGAKAAVERGKGLLREAKSEPDPLRELKSASVPASPGPKEEACEVPFQEAKKMPRNYMESKFMICSVRDMAEEAEGKGKDASSAKEGLRQAEQAFQAQQYTEALRHALRAKKVLEGREEAPAPKAQEMEGVERVPSAVVLRPPASKCAQCSAELDSGDLFCAKCGAKVERDIRCPRCANNVNVNDAYCRKCGLPLRGD